MGFRSRFEREGRGEQYASFTSSWSGTGITTVTIDPAAGKRFLLTALGFAGATVLQAAAAADTVIRVQHWIYAEGTSQSFAIARYHLVGANGAFVENHHPMTMVDLPPGGLLVGAADVGISIQTDRTLVAGSAAQSLDGATILLRGFTEID